MKKPSKAGVVKAIVFCDTSNNTIDQKYADSLREEFRKQTGWVVAEGTRIHTMLGEFSKGYNRKRRDVGEVAVIFRMANGLMNVKPSTVTPVRKRMRK